MDLPYDVRANIRPGQIPSRRKLNIHTRIQGVENECLELCSIGHRKSPRKAV